MIEEESRSSDASINGDTFNDLAPRMVKQKAPPRKQKAFYIQEKYSDAFDDLAYKQKKSGGKKATELAEEAIYLLLTKYGENVSSL